MNYIEIDKKTFNENYFKSAVKLFIKKSQNKNESRYKSWEYCYNFFHSVHEKISDKKLSLKSPFGDDGQNWTYKDQLCLHLAFYMASWGMYRGSSFLLQNDYTIYYDVVDAIFKDDYKELWKDKNLFIGNIENKILNLYKDMQGALYRFKDFYDTKSYFCNYIKDKEVEYNPKFLTIITKIMLGTIGCFPALDRNFKYGFGISDGSKKSNFVKQTIKRVFDFALNKKEEIKIALKEIKYAELPIMKAIDMYYFIKGQEDTFLYNLSFEKKNFGNITSDGVIGKINNFYGNKTSKTRDAAKFLYNNICKKDIYVAREEIVVACKNAHQKILEFVRDNYKEEDDEKFEKD